MARLALIFPVTLGTGKRLRRGGTRAASFTLVGSNSPSGAIIASYKRAGDVQTGSV
jgi:hypothetical protein